MINKQTLKRLYFDEGKSMAEIAQKLKCSPNKVVYWMKKHEIERRTWSDATYVKKNPNGDPFKFRKPRTMKEAELFGLGIGLYWGEGTKSNKNTIRLGNTDPELIKAFINFLTTFFQIDEQSLKYGLQIFSDLKKEKVLAFWIDQLGANRVQFHEPTITKSGSIGTYRRKSQYGVLTVHYNNSKARQKLSEIMPM